MGGDMAVMEVVAMEVVMVGTEVVAMEVVMEDTGLHTARRTEDIITTTTIHKKALLYKKPLGLEIFNHLLTDLLDSLNS